METQTKKRSKDELIKEAAQLAEDHNRLKETILKMLDELDKLEMKHERILDEIIKNK